MERQRRMITLGDILRSQCIDLNLTHTSQDAAIHHMAELLRGDERVNDWPGLLRGIQSRDPCIAGGQEFDICIPHARTDAVNAMVMAAGRSAAGIERGEGKGRVHYVFVIGVPVPQVSDYLRIIGALARIFRHPETEQMLRSTGTVQGFLDLLVRKEMEL
jgi:mannitol/fructose-specific phosphotransferase system IIA component (Ntr-type)